MTEPTDKELAALRAEFGITSNGRGIREFTQVIGFARAVLAKWGQPQAVAGGEPVDRVFIVATGEEHEGEATYTRYDHAPPPLCDSECLYTAPQPAVAAGWMPIETAPKHESVLLYSGGFTPIYCGRRRYGLLGEPQQDVLAWRCDSSGRFANPTRWLPLPPAPSTEGESNV